MRRWVVAIAIGGLVVVGGYFLARPDSCDGIPREMGACSADRPSYVGSNCDEVAVEWGDQLNERVIAVINGPAAAGGEGRSVRLRTAEILVTQLANKHLRDTGLTPNCDADTFMSLGEDEFSELLVQQVGSIMYEGSPTVEYDEWRQRVRDFVELILLEPDVPYEGTG